jgi:hypothetical protein
MSAEPPSTGFLYVDSDIPPGVTIAEYRATRAREAARSRRCRTIAGWARATRRGLAGAARTLAATGRGRVRSAWPRVAAATGACRAAARALAGPRIARLRRARRPASGSAPGGAHGH